MQPCLQRDGRPGLDAIADAPKQGVGQELAIRLLPSPVAPEV